MLKNPTKKVKSSSEYGDELYCLMIFLKFYCTVQQWTCTEVCVEFDDDDSGDDDDDDAAAAAAADH